VGATLWPEQVLLAPAGAIVNSPDAPPDTLSVPTLSVPLPVFCRVTVFCVDTPGEVEKFLLLGSDTAGAVPVPETARVRSSPLALVTGTVTVSL